MHPTAAGRTAAESREGARWPREEAGSFEGFTRWSGGRARTCLPGGAVRRRQDRVRFGKPGRLVRRPGEACTSRRSSRLAGGRSTPLTESDGNGAVVTRESGGAKIPFASRSGQHSPFWLLSVPEEPMLGEQVTEHVDPMQGRCLVELVHRFV